MRWTWSGHVAIALCEWTFRMQIGNVCTSSFRVSTGSTRAVWTSVNNLNFLFSLWPFRWNAVENMSGIAAFRIENGQIFPVDSIISPVDSCSAENKCYLTINAQFICIELPKELTRKNNCLWIRATNTVWQQHMPINTSTCYKNSNQ